LRKENVEKIREGNEKKEMAKNFRTFALDADHASSGREAGESEKS